MILDMISWVAVYLYGLALTAAFLSLPLTKKGILIAAVQTALCVALQFWILDAFGSHAVEMAYPLICHLPILLSSVLLYRRSLSSSAVALLAAYLLTIPRNLCGELVALVWTASCAKDITKIIVTIPLLFLFLKLLTPVMRKILLRSSREKWLFLVPALVYYVMIYVTSVYTQAAYHGSFAVMSLLGTLLCLCTFIYVFMDYRQLAEVSELRQKQEIMDLQASETALRMEEIRYTQQKTKTMRHDLRHYLQIIYDYAAEGNAAAIECYIHSIQGEIEDTVVQEYCKNESVNLILSSYHGKAKRQGVELSVSAGVPQELDGELDVCVLLANGIENALHASYGIEDAKITVECNRYAGKTVIQIKNAYQGEIKFADGLPVSGREGHGFGTKSIAALAESHGGAADFSAKDGTFTLRAVM